MAVCPQGCITIEGRCLSADDVIEQSPNAAPTDYPGLYDLMLQRRSMRSFTDEGISQEYIKKLLAAAVTAPVGVPPSEVGVVVLAGREKVAAFASDLIGHIRKIKWLFAKPAVYAMRAFMSKDQFASFVSLCLFYSIGLMTPIAREKTGCSLMRPC
jgi:hypothetical protein